MNGDLPPGADVVVVGGGLAGNAAALAAAEHGATVCLLEKERDIGGSSVKSGGELLFAGTALQREHGVDDNPGRLREAIMAAGRGQSDPAAVEVYVAHQLATFDWIRRHGLEFSLAPANDDVNVPRIHAAPRGALTRLLHERFEATGRGGTWAGAAVRRLLTQDGRVTGVLARYGSHDLPVSARRGVVLATGGFTQSPALLRTFAPQWADAVTMGGAGNTGDGLRMAMALGAQLADMGSIEATFGASATDFPGCPATQPTPGSSSRTRRAGSSSTGRAGGSPTRR